MSHNIPTVSDVPFSVGGLHRYDFGNPNASHVCMHQVGGTCPSSLGTDYSGCPVRCWGHGMTGPNRARPQNHLEAYGFVRGGDNGGADTVPWMDPFPTDVWNYPQSLSPDPPSNPLSSSSSVVPTQSFNPQGYLFTLSGSPGSPGFVDGPPTVARFSSPEGVAVDKDGYLFVADTSNHAIRVVSPSGHATTLCGLGTPGYEDGGAETARFSSPTKVAVWYDWRWWDSPSTVDPDKSVWRNGNGNLTLFVADTGNHRIRKVTFRTSGGDDDDGSLDKTFHDVSVTCFSGRCGNGTSSLTHTLSPAPPSPGYADGHPSVSRFNSPRGITVTDSGDVVVADTNNHLIRVLNRNGTAHTLAGAVEIAELDPDDPKGMTPMPGCPPPCLKGVQGGRDGNLTHAQFSYPRDVACYGNSSGVHAVNVADGARVRRVTFESETVEAGGKWIDVVTDLQGLRSRGRVVTVAGGFVDGVTGTDVGDRDGGGNETQFRAPESLVVTSDEITYIVDRVSCRVRRISPAGRTAVTVPTCLATVDHVARSEGCASYDPPVDELDLKATPARGFVYDNYLYRGEFDVELGGEYPGRMIKDCVGPPPRDRLDKMSWDNITSSYPYNLNLVVDDRQIDTNENPEEGTTLKVHCPSSCTSPPSALAAASGMVEGGPFYSSTSPVCAAAVHAGALDPDAGGYVTVTLQRGVHARDANKVTPSTRNGVTSLPVPYHSQRLFTVSPYPRSSVHVQTISGGVGAMLEEGCGHRDSQPPQSGQFLSPGGIAAYRNGTVDNSTNFVFVADTGNHVLRAMTAACSSPCENGGTCVGPDTCRCKTGWEGVDCTEPVCPGPCGPREICTGPGSCTCIPGYAGPGCTEALCVQSCENGGVCSAPDTCQCVEGWFDSNCTTPVCSQTCGNGGNCTGPDECACPGDWSGHDCRVPVCEQTCGNGGYCTAPDTCTCPPQWSGHDCSLPVCHQGYMRPDGGGGGREKGRPTPTPWGG